MHSIYHATSAIPLLTQHLLRAIVLTMISHSFAAPSYAEKHKQPPTPTYQFDSLSSDRAQRLLQQHQLALDRTLYPAQHYSVPQQKYSPPKYLRPDHKGALDQAIIAIMAGRKARNSNTQHRPIPLNKRAAYLLSPLQDDYVLHLYTTSAPPLRFLHKKWDIHKLHGNPARTHTNTFLLFRSSDAQSDEASGPFVLQLGKFISGRYAKTKTPPKHQLFSPGSVLALQGNDTMGKPSPQAPTQLLLLQDLPEGIFHVARALRNTE